MISSTVRRVVRFVSSMLSPLCAQSGDVLVVIKDRS